MRYLRQSAGDAVAAPVVGCLPESPPLWDQSTGVVQHPVWGLLVGLSELCLHSFGSAPWTAYVNTVAHTFDNYSAAAAQLEAAAGLTLKNKEQAVLQKPPP